MIVHHKWADLVCTRCGTRRQKYGSHWEWKHEKGTWWSTTPSDCTGDRTAPFRVAHRVPVPQMSKHEPDWYFTLYRGTEANCVRFLRDHARTMALSPDELSQNYRIERNLK